MAQEKRGGAECETKSERISIDRLTRILTLALDTHKVGDVPVLITQRGNEKLVPERGTVHTVVEETDRHVVTLINGLTDTLDRLWVGLGSLQETTVTSKDLVQRVTRQIEKALTGVDDRVVGQGRIRNDKVLLGRLKGLDERKVGIVEDLVGNSLTGGEETIDISSRAGLVKKLCGLGSAKLALNGLLELFVLFLEKSNRLLEGLEEELFTVTRLLGVVLVAVAVERGAKGKQ